MHVRLRRQSLRVRAPRELCFEVVAAAGKTRERRSPTESIVEFRSNYKGRDIVTVERVVLDRPEVIHYEWLEGPLPEVIESISFVEVDPSTTDLVYEGRFSAGDGLWRWFLGLLFVKRNFDRLVTEHLRLGRDMSERRASRSHVYGSGSRE